MAKQTRRELLKRAGFAAASAGVLSVLPGCAEAVRGKRAERKQPNVIILFTDDQRFDTIGALGNEHIITPNIDSLVHEGTAFTNAYIMGSMSGAVCVPSRAMLMTGRTLFHLQGDGHRVPEKHITLPQTLGRAGYTTFGTGKWHQDAGTFVRSFSAGARVFLGGMSDHYRIGVRDFAGAPTKSGGNEYYAEGKHSSELFSDAAIDFLHSYRGQEPFFLYVAYTAPHDPRTAPKKYKDMYDAEDIVLPKNFLPVHPFDNGELEIRDEKLAPWPRTEEIVREHIADYYAIITHLDSQIGRLLRVLKETGQAENTIIVFAGDNGLAVGRHGLMGKQSLYEHSVHVPLIISGPGIAKDQKCNAFCYLLDIFPTICELVGVGTPGSVEGKSLVPVIRGQKQEVRDSLFFAYKDLQRGIRDKRYKLIEYIVKGKRTTQLFDLQADPWEMNNLAGKCEYAAELKRLRKRLVLWKERLGDTHRQGTKFWQDYGLSAQAGRGV